MTGKQSKKQMFFTLSSGEPDPYRFERHLYSLIVAGIGCCLFPVVALFVDKTGAVLAKVATFPVLNDPFKLTLSSTRDTVVPRNQWCTFFSVLVPRDLMEKWNSLLAFSCRHFLA